MHSDYIQAIDKCIRRRSRVFGGIFTLLAGDFRATAPIISQHPDQAEPDLSRLHVASLLSMAVWKKCTVMQLHGNMRLLHDGSTGGWTAEELQQIGDGECPITDIDGAACTRILTSCACLKATARSLERWSMYGRSWSSILIKLLGLPVDRCSLPPTRWSMRSMNVWQTYSSRQMILWNC